LRGLVTEQTAESYAATFDSNVLGVLLSMKHELRGCCRRGTGASSMCHRPMEPSAERLRKRCWGECARGRRSPAPPLSLLPDTTPFVYNARGGLGKLPVERDRTPIHLWSRFDGTQAQRSQEGRSSAYASVDSGSRNQSASLRRSR
jgi:hypothetical protein